MKIKMTAVTMFVIAVCLYASPVAGSIDTEPQQYDGWRLVWHDEFDTDGKLNTEVWNYENGFMRNHEAQWYQAENAYCEDGNLVIEARKEAVPRMSPWYDRNSKRWPNDIEKIQYTSASVNTAGKKEFLYCRLEVRAKIPVGPGAWPAIWLLGSGMDWPSCGEIDVMEFYRKQDVPHILANACWGTDRPWTAKWNSKAVPFTHFTDRDAKWAEKYHVWRMDWDEDMIRIYLDGELMNEIRQEEAVNGKLGRGEQPFKKPLYLLLNLALGGDNGGVIDDNALPMKYLIDYVRVYQRDC